MLWHVLLYHDLRIGMKIRWNMRRYVMKEYVMIKYVTKYDYWIVNEILCACIRVMIQ